MVQSRGEERRRRAKVAICLGVALAVGGCVERAAEVTPEATARHIIAKREGMNLSAASVALVSVEGAPPSLGEGFASDVAEAAKSREIRIVDADAARYFLRGYLSARPTEDGAEVEYVWDVFGPDKRREFRLNDVFEVKGKGDDAWDIVTPRALAGVAAKSADDLAAFLSNSPEAKPIADAAAPGGKALAYASE